MSASASEGHSRNKHQRIVERSRALHRIVAERVLGDDRWLRVARENVERWIANEERFGAVSPGLLEWRRLLRDATRQEIVNLLLDESERGDRLRHATPFCGVLTAEEREAVFKRHATTSA